MTNIKEVVKAADRVAREYNNEYMTPEHIFYAILEGVEGFRWIVEELKDFGVDLDRLKSDLAYYFLHLDDPADGKDVYKVTDTLVSAGAKKAFDSMRRDSIAKNYLGMSDILGSLLAADTEVLENAFVIQGVNVGEVLNVLDEEEELIENAYMQYLDENAKKTGVEPNTLSEQTLGMLRELIADQFEKYTGQKVSADKITFGAEVYDGPSDMWKTVDVSIESGNEVVSSSVIFNKDPDGNTYSEMKKELEKLGYTQASKEYTDVDEEEKSEIPEFKSKLLKVLKVDPKKVHHFGRAKEIGNCLDSLCRVSNNSVIVAGAPGVGKSAFIYGVLDKVARMKKDDARYTKLQDMTFLKLDTQGVIAGSIYRGQVEEKLTEAFNLALNSFKNPVIFIDDFQYACSSGGSQLDTVGFDGILRKYANSIRFIGAMDIDLYYKSVATKPDLSRRFKLLELKEPSEEECYRILRGVRALYEEYHGVSYSEEVLKYVIKMSREYLKERALPDKALDLLDELGVVCTKEKKTEVNNGMVDKLVSKRCGIPIRNLTKSSLAQIKGLKNKLSSKVFGQESAVEDLRKLIQIHYTGLSDDNKPVGSFLFAGPTGVGKTELARVLAESLNYEMVKLDMSEYSEQHSVSKLIGSPQGYVGYGDTESTLVSRIRKNPKCVLLFDEIEKAHANVYNMLLQVLDDAVLTDTHGIKASFRDAIIIMTSNSGASDSEKRGIGFGSQSNKPDAIQKAINDTFSPEFRGRFTGIIQFNGLNTDMAKMITKKFIGNVEEKLKARDITLSLTDEAVDFIIDSGYTTSKGARGIKEVVDRQLKVLISDYIVRANPKGGELHVYVDKNKKELMCGNKIPRQA